MKLEDVESFFNSIAYLYITDFEGDFQNVLTASGISLDRVPRGTLGFEALEKFHNEMLIKKDRDLVVMDIDADLKILEKKTMKGISTTPHILAKQFELYRKKYEAYQVTKSIESEPDRIEEILQDYAFKSLNPVQWDWLEGFSQDAITEHDKSVKENKVIVTIPGYEKLADMIGGFNPSRIAILTGTTGFGKTNLGLSLSLAARKKMGVAYVNMEMSYQDMTRRICVALTGDTYNEFNKREVSRTAIEKINEYPKSFAMTSGRSLSIAQIIAWVRMLNSQRKISFLVIDYDQKLDIQFKRDTPEWKELQTSIERLEDLAKELDLFCIVLAQVNREGEISGSFRAQFPAHSVLSFEMHEEHGPLISAKKNRHGRKNQALKVSYNESNSQIKELEIINLKIGKKTKRELKTKNTTANLPYKE